MSTGSGAKKSNSKPSYKRDSRIISNGERGRVSDKHGVDPILRAKTIATMELAKAARNKLSNAMSAGLGGTTTANATSALAANKDGVLCLSDDEYGSDFDYDNVDGVDDTVVDLSKDPNEFDDDDEGLQRKIQSIIPQGKGKAPLNQLVGDVVRVMKDRVKSNYSEGNPDTTSLEQLRNMLVSVVQNKALILAKAAVLDMTMDVANHPVGTTICGLLIELIPDKVPVKTVKSYISAALVNTWSLLSEVLKYCSFRRREAHDLQIYIQYMSRVELLVKRVLDEDKSAPIKMKSINLSSAMMDRCYLEGGGFATPPWCSMCCRCGHKCPDQPKENKVASKETAKNQRQWLADNERVHKYTIGQGPPLLNKKDKVITTVPSAKVLPEYYMCHCWQQMMSYVAAGVSGCYFKCLVDGIQYKIGQCPHCKCDCSFVVDKSRYIEKKQLFAHMKAMEGVTKRNDIACANDLLNDAARVRSMTAETTLAAAQYQRKSGMIGSDIYDEDLQRSAAAHGYLAQANYITNTGLNLPQYEKFENAVSLLETEHGGATMTKIYGNVSGDRRAKQRSKNTGPEGLNLTDGYSSVAAFASGGGGGNVTLSSSRKSPHLNVASGSNLGGDSGNVVSSGYPKLDIFAPPAAQPKKRSGTDRIWGRTRGANARELHLDIAKDDLTSPMKKSRKAAKKTAKKMKHDDSDHLDSVHCMLATDGIPLSQATAYEAGDVKNKHGGTFCSQRALRQYRNSNESDSDD